MYHLVSFIDKSFTLTCHFRKAATHDSEIRYLYEEMEAQIKNEKERLLLKVKELRHEENLTMKHLLGNRRIKKDSEIQSKMFKDMYAGLHCTEVHSMTQDDQLQI